LQINCSTYETREGIADIRAAVRHSHTTGLVRLGATLVEAKQLARHADVRQTMKCAHIGLNDQGQALANKSGDYGLQFPASRGTRRSGPSLPRGDKTPLDLFRRELAAWPAEIAEPLKFA
jgi:hypothetical protein